MTSCHVGECVCVCRGEERILMQMKCGARGNSIWVWWVYIQRYVNIKCTEWQLGSAAILSVGCPTWKISCSASLISCSKKGKTPDYSPNICFPSFQTPPATVMRCVEYLQAAVQCAKNENGETGCQTFHFHPLRETCTLYRGKHRRRCKELKHVSLIIKTNNNICVLNCSLGSDFCFSWHTFSS